MGFEGVEGEIGILGDNLVLSELLMEIRPMGTLEECLVLRKYQLAFQPMAFE
jgi:hypothetical protein